MYIITIEDEMNLFLTSPSFDELLEWAALKVSTNAIRTLGWRDTGTFVYQPTLTSNGSGGDDDEDVKGQT